MSKAPNAAPTEEAPRKKRRGASVMAWVLMAMLIGGLGGFGVTNFGGGTTSIGKVGQSVISTDDYAMGLRNQINTLSRQFGTQLNFQQAQALGVDRQVLQSLIDRTALDNEAGKIGLSVGNMVVADELAKISAFQGTAGVFDRETYRQALKQDGRSEAVFEAAVRADKARQLLQGSISGGFSAPQALTDTIFGWAAEKRDFSVLTLNEADLTAPVPAPTEAEIAAYYAANIAQYTRPEAKRISYAALLPDTMAATLEVPEPEVQAAYDARRSEFLIPEKRLVERLAFATDADAAAAKARLDAGESFDTLVTERGLTLEDVDLGDTSQAELGDAGPAIFALAEPGVVGPFASSIGPALFRMNAILAAQETTFDQARPGLLLELQLAAARKVIATKVEAIDDALAGGAALADLASEQGMTLATTDYAVGADDNDPIAGYTAFRDAATKLNEGDFPEAIMLEDGGIVSLQLVENLPPTALPLEKVKDKVIAAATAEALAKALAEKGQAVKAEVDAGAALTTQGIVARSVGLDRQASLTDQPETLLKAVFEMAAGDVRVIQGVGTTSVVQLDAITPAAQDGTDAAAMHDAIAAQASKAMAEDVFSLYTGALTDEAGISLDQAAINAVNSRMSN